MLSRRQLLALGGAAAGGLLWAGCSKKAGFVVGSKNFQEQWILAALITKLVGKRTKTRARAKDFAGTLLSHKAITSGGIQCYVEYTGTALTAVLDMPPQQDVDAVYEIVKREYANRFDLHWLAPLGFENTFAILVRKADADRHGLAKISDLRRVAGDFRPGFGFEFYDRPDGYRGLVDRYQLEFGQPPKQMKLGLTYRALDAGEVDVIAGNSTDGLIAHLGLVMLEDDLGFFPPYHAAPLITGAVARNKPAIVEVLGSLAGKIDAETMRRANYRVDGDKQSPVEAADALLSEIGLG
jgi:glycine betaine/choline ABC-type transport system substrate-binding protein